ncbi:AEL338Cp [Eremothecium gossypii ATCC 10895]|uniref:Glutamate--tRNA ligase, mitochondrial n=1 Tax=Eremothecium gossypii (strain ATCC 10895 / CBS 109.51 / FGSC 9923 / NRRL Y-1056) TaxID=284811 RepID=Q758U0_EREGS|nr:AEL338Cp [Eremothecium gossypii ATCC 10895]AAS52346.1 AEL338Cp [Eremothecium gossypii ATCC 10895]AEY96643.1 FAEL338Cp [Eremothecium gossypii FDAG1]
MVCTFAVRRYTASILRPRIGLLSGKQIAISRKPTRDVHPKTPARTRFAPSPTGYLHLGSLRTALYNYLLARNTNGQFLLRLEDTDQKRLVSDAEQNIYDTLQWLGIQFDEGPGVNEVYGPYRQSDRSAIYKAHADKLLASGHAYRCFCSKERLENLRTSAMALQPPTNVSYDRECANLSQEHIDHKLDQNVPFTLRFKSPAVYEPFEDLLHGRVDLQPQTNPNDIRYDDPVLMKSDGLPTYHFANVVDDHLMKITHVIRGEEWLPSTPKHISLYRAFGWTPPKFVHIPLLTTAADKKLSKRKGDASVMALKAKGVLPEALLNFSVLFGWAPPRELATANHECFTLGEFERLFNLNNLTKGNAKVDEKKLWFFNKHYLSARLKDEHQVSIEARNLTQILSKKYPGLDETKTKQLLKAVGGHLTVIDELESQFHYLLSKPVYENEFSDRFIKACEPSQVARVLSSIASLLDNSNLNDLVAEVSTRENVPKKAVFEAMRFALSGSVPGLKLPVLISTLGLEETKARLNEAAQYLVT